MLSPQISTFKTYGYSKAFCQSKESIALLMAVRMAPLFIYYVEDYKITIFFFFAQVSYLLSILNYNYSFYSIHALETNIFMLNYKPFI